MSSMDNLTAGPVLAAPPTTPVPNPPAPGAAITIPPINPNFNAPGVKGLSSLGDTIAAWVLVLAVIAILLGVLIAVVGPRMGFHGAKSVGIGGVVGGFIVGGVVAMATPGVTTVYGWFHGGAA